VISEVKSDTYTIIKRQLLNRDYPPGYTLSIRKLAQELEVSPTPVREAIIKLEVEGLVRRVPNSCATVTEVSFQGLRDAFELRLFLMEFVGRLAAQRVTEDQFVAMEGLLEAIRNEKSHKKLIELDDQFHRLINKATGNLVLAKTLDGLRSKLTRLWFFEPDEESLTSREKRIENFEQLLVVLKKRDATEVSRALKSHVMGFVEQVSATLLAMNDNTKHQDRR